MSDEVTYRTSHGRQLEVLRPVETPAKAVMEHPEVREYVNDFQEALNLIQEYQRALNIMAAPDPNIVKANALLRKYRLAPEKITHAFRVIVDGIDITEHPDSIEATGEEVVVEEIVDAVVVGELEIEAGNE